MKDAFWNFWYVNHSVTTLVRDLYWIARGKPW